MLSRSPPPAAQGPRFALLGLALAARRWGRATSFTSPHRTGDPPPSTANHRTASDNRTTIRLVGLANREVHTKQRSRTRNLEFKKRESPRQEAFSLNVRLMVRLASYFSTPAMMILDPGGRFSQKNPGKVHLTRAWQTQRAPKDTDPNAGKRRE